RSRLSQHPAAVQSARRIPARQWPPHLSPTGHAAHASFPLRCTTRPCWPPLGLASVRFLGRIATTHPAARKRFSLWCSNFAEVEFCTRNLNQNRSRNLYETAFNFGIQDKQL